MDENTLDIISKETKQSIPTASDSVSGSGSRLGSTGSSRVPLVTDVV